MTYEIKCIGCNNVYVGETLTSRRAYTGGKEHSKSLGIKEERSALWKNCREKHSSEIQQFQMNVIGVYFNDAMLRQISEGIKINNVDEGSLINSKKRMELFSESRMGVLSHRDEISRGDIYEV